MAATAVVCVPHFLPALKNSGEQIHGLDSRYSVVDLQTHGKVIALSYSPDGKYIAAGSQYSEATPLTWEGDLVIWEAATGKEHFRKHFSQWVQSVAFHPAGTHVVVSCSSWNVSREGYLNFVQKPGELHVYEFPSMRELKSLNFDLITGRVRFSPDGNMLAVVYDRDKHLSGPHSAEIAILGFPSLAKVATIKDLRSVPVGTPPIAFTPDSKEILSVNFRSSTVSVFDSKTGAFRSTQKDILPGNLEFTKDGILVSWGGIVSFFDYPNKRYAFEFSHILAKRGTAAGHIRWASLSPNKKHLLAIDGIGGGAGSRSPNAKVLIEDFDKKELFTIFEVQGAKFNRCCWNPDGKSFAVGTSFYRGIHGKEGDPLHGHVLIFRPKE
jgi:WD40 repeat protein